MIYIFCIFMGIIQGITEFMPVSSFGHTVNLQVILEIDKSGSAFLGALLHMGTLFAVLIYFWKDVKKIGKELSGIAKDLTENTKILINNRRKGENNDYIRISTGTYRKFTVLLLISTIPTFLLGYSVRRIVDMACLSAIMPGVCFLLSGVIMLVVDISPVRTHKMPREIDYADAMWMGIMQGISAFPGLSRFGLTVCVGKLCGIHDKVAIKYSLIMSIPAVFGAFLAELKGFAAPAMTVETGTAYLVGMLAAAVTGYFVIKKMMVFLQKIHMRYFAFYCFAAGIASFVINIG